MIPSLNNKDQFGFYKIGDSLTTYSKIEAIELSTRLNLPVKWIFNEHIYSNINWTHEPSESLLDIYARRARQIREKYDYIVIFYSGGADSNNVLLSFLNNGLHVDEIAQFHTYQGDGSWDSYFNEEIKKVALPETQKILEKFPLIKHRVIDLSEIIHNLLNDDDNRFDFIYKCNSVFSPNQLSRTYFRERIKDYQDIIDSGRKLCFVWGTDKPCLKYVNNRFAVNFRDSLIDMAVGSRTQQLNREWEHDELFYWSPDCPEIPVKQGHLIMKYLKSFPIDSTDHRWVAPWVTVPEDPIRKTIGYNPYSLAPNSIHGDVIRNGVKYSLTPDGLHQIIYPFWNPDTFSNGKPPSLIFSPRDSWWRKDINEKNQLMHANAMAKLISVYKHKWFTCKPIYTNQTFDMKTSNIRTIESQLYFLE